MVCLYNSKKTSFLIKCVCFAVLIILFSLSSCSIGGPAGRYLSHVNKIYSILLKHPEDAEAAADAVYEYVERNHESITKASMEMKKLSVEETEKVYIPVIRAIRTIDEYIKEHSTDEYPLVSQEKLLLAISILLK